MHFTEIDHRATVQNCGFDLEDDRVGDRPVLLTGFAGVDGTDLMVPVDEEHPESYILALTNEQAGQMLLSLAEQIGKHAALKLIEDSE